MAEYITVDSGTTNTRLRLVCNGVVTDTLRYAVGARTVVQGRPVLRETLREGIAALLQKNGKTEADITRILAAGMITSEFGLVELPHITTPAGIKELHAALYETVMPDISAIPIVFVRGVRTPCTDLENADVMRGEEAELAGLWQGEGVYILPGSHSKHIETDAQGCITGFATLFSGEMLAALAQDTILRDAVDLSLEASDEEFLLQGYRCSAEKGINEALFKVRLLKTVFHRTPQQILSFYLGAVLCGEIQSLLARAPKRICIGGKGAIRRPMATLLGTLSDAAIICIEEQTAETASARGMVQIYEYGANA